MHTAGTAKLSSSGESSIEVCGLICHLFRPIFKHLPRICTCYGTSYCMYILCDLNILPRPSLFFRARRYVMRKGRKRRPFPPSGVRRRALGIGSILYTYREDGERRGRIWHIKRRRQVKGEGRGGRNGSLGSRRRRRRKGPSPTLHYTRRGECPKGEHGRME